MKVRTPVKAGAWLETPVGERIALRRPFEDLQRSLKR